MYYLCVTDGQRLRESWDLMLGSSQILLSHQRHKTPWVSKKCVKTGMAFVLLQCYHFRNASRLSNYEVSNLVMRNKYSETWTFKSCWWERRLAARPWVLTNFWVGGAASLGFLGKATPLGLCCNCPCLRNSPTPSPPTCTASLPASSRDPIQGPGVTKALLSHCPCPGLDSDCDTSPSLFSSQSISAVYGAGRDNGFLTVCISNLIFHFLN